MSTFDPMDANDIEEPIDFEGCPVDMKMAPVVLHKMPSERRSCTLNKKSKKTTFAAKSATPIKKDSFLLKPKRWLCAYN
jgi:hypothetical protein